MPVRRPPRKQGEYTQKVLERLSASHPKQLNVRPGTNDNHNQGILSQVSSVMPAGVSREGTGGGAGRGHLLQNVASPFLIRHNGHAHPDGISPDAPKTHQVEQLLQQISPLRRGSADVSPNRRVNVEISPTREPSSSHHAQPQHVHYLKEDSGPESSHASHHHHPKDPPEDPKRPRDGPEKRTRNLKAAPVVRTPRTHVQEGGQAHARAQDALQSIGEAEDQELSASMRDVLSIEPGNKSPQRKREKDKIMWRVMPDLGDMLVKDSDDLKTVVHAARPGARIFVSEGLHEWTGTIVIDKTVHIIGAGAWITVLQGRWTLMEYASMGGDKSNAKDESVRETFESQRPITSGFSGVELRHPAGQGRKMHLYGNYLEETVHVKGGKWRFLSCKLACAGAPPLVCSGRCEVDLLECRIGGCSSHETASSGVIVQGESKCKLHTCTVEYTDSEGYKGIDVLPTKERAALVPTSTQTEPHHAEQQKRALEAPFQSSAVLVRHTASVHLECCQFLHGLWALTVDGAAHALVWDCLFQEHNKGGIFLLLSRGDSFRETVLDVKDNRIARSQEKVKVAVGRVSKYVRRDGEDPNNPNVRAAHSRLEALFDTDKCLYTTMGLSFR